jgi:hypothetical protein
MSALRQFPVLSPAPRASIRIHKKDVSKKSDVSVRISTDTPGSFHITRISVEIMLFYSVTWKTVLLAPSLALHMLYDE